MARIFISYRRDDAGGYSLLLFERLSKHFGRGRVFMDIDTIEPGVDFAHVIEKAVGSCDALIALIGKQWLNIHDENGRRRIDNPEDYVRLEIAAALRRDIRVIPVLVRGARMPNSDELPDPLKGLARRNAYELSDTRFAYDLDQLIDVLGKVPTQDMLYPPSWLDKLERFQTSERNLDDRGAMTSTTPVPRPTRLLFEPEVIHIPAGPFLMGEQNRLYALEDYCIGRHPVKVMEYRAFLQTDGYRVRQYWTEAGWAWKEALKRTQPDYWDDAQWIEIDSLPVIGVSWYEAFAYCNWLAQKTGRPYRLPTDSEWEKAARGTDGRLYPWGDEPRQSVCNTYAASIGHTTPAGRYSPGGDSPYGIADMIGNVAEWCQTKWRKNDQTPEDNDPEGKASRVLHGGSWAGVKIVQAAARGRTNPDTTNNFIGFRVARTGA
jgi:formylglycine-generating enzyme required for sulfatase activity